MYVLNEALKRKKYSEPDLFAPGEPCKCKCSDDCGRSRMRKSAERLAKIARFATKNEAYEMLKTGMTRRSLLSYFAVMQKLEFLSIRSHIYSDSGAGANQADAKICRSVLGPRRKFTCIFILLRTRNALRKGKSFFRAKRANPAKRRDRRN